MVDPYCVYWCVVCCPGYVLNLVMIFTQMCTGQRSVVVLYCVTVAFLNPFYVYGKFGIIYLPGLGSRCCVVFHNTFCRIEYTIFEGCVSVSSPFGSSGIFTGSNSK